MQTAHTCRAKADAFRAMLTTTFDESERRCLARRMRRAERDAAASADAAARRETRQLMLARDYAMAMA